MQIVNNGINTEKKERKEEARTRRIPVLPEERMEAVKNRH